jgi:hypothetical protein
MASMATVVARRCSAVARAEAGSNRMAAARSRAAPAMASKARPPVEPGPSVIASASEEIPTRPIANSTAVAAGSPGSASRLIVRASGS